MRRARFSSAGRCLGHLSDAIEQFADANGTGSASNTVANTGTMTLSAKPSRTARRTRRRAQRTRRRIGQSATAADGDASNTVTNSATGVLNITSIARANATLGSADANASLGTVIDQSATANLGGNATNTVTNDGTHQRPGARGCDGHERIRFRVDHQRHRAVRDANGGGDAANIVTNTGVMTIAATAYGQCDELRRRERQRNRAEHLPVGDCGHQRHRVEPGHQLQHRGHYDDRRSQRQRRHQRLGGCLLHRRGDRTAGERHGCRRPGPQHRG